MDFLDKNQMLQIFLEESLDCLYELSTQLLILEKNKEDEEAIKIIFRNAHTLKGNSFTVYGTYTDENESETDYQLENINQLAIVTHALETLIMEARDNGMKITNVHIDLLFETEQTLEMLLSLIESQSDELFDVSSLQQKLLNSITKESADESPAENTQPIIENQDLGITFRLDTELESDFIFASLSIVYREIEDKYENVSFLPTPTDVENGIPFTDVFVTIQTTESNEQIIQFLNDLTFVKQAYTMDDNRQLSNVSQATEEMAESIVTSEEKEVDLSVETTKQVNAEESPKTPVAKTNNQSSSKPLRVPIDRIDEVLKHVSSLVILRNKLLNISKKVNDKSLFDVADEMSQSIDFLQESVMNIRMTPLDQLFSRYPKDVRNIAKEFNKKVDFECIGGETEIDKSLLDELSKPLAHLIKNSIFHGIESEEERIAAGKKPEGLLRLSAKHEQDNVVITIEDDGKGMPVDKIRKKAIEKNIITEETAKKMSREEIVNLSFHPGLSTAESVNNIAGRGVGMDAVRAVVEEMKGHITIETEEGKGTKVIIGLPLTLAIIPAMLTKIEGKYFSIPSSQILEAVDIDASELKYVANKEVYILRKQEIPIIRLKEFFNLSCERKENEKLKIVILKSGNKTIGTTVDEFVELENIVVKNIGEYLGNITGIAGCNILGDGSISLIVDVNTITHAIKK